MRAARVMCAAAAAYAVVGERSVASLPWRRRDDAFENSNTTTRDARGVRFYIPVTFARTSFCDRRKIGFSLRLLSRALPARRTSC